MNHKQRMKLPKKIRLNHLIRKTWGELNPTTKVIESKKKYKRSKEKKESRRYFDCEW